MFRGLGNSGMESVLLTLLVWACGSTAQARCPLRARVAAGAFAFAN